MKNELPNFPENAETPTPPDLQKTLEAYRLNLQALLLYMEKQHGFGREAVAKHLHRSTAKVLQDFRYEEDGVFFSHTPTGPIPLVRVIGREQPNEFVFQSLAHSEDETKNELIESGDSRILRPKAERTSDMELTPVLPEARLKKLVETTEPITPTIPMAIDNTPAGTLAEAILLYADVEFQYVMEANGNVTPKPTNKLELDHGELLQCLKNR